MSIGDWFALILSVVLMGGMAWLCVYLFAQVIDAECDVCKGTRTHYSRRTPRRLTQHEEAIFNEANWIAETKDARTNVVSESKANREHDSEREWEF